MAKRATGRYHRAMRDLPTVMVTGAGGYLGRPVVAALTGRAKLIPAQIDGRRADVLDRDDRAKLMGGAAAEVLVHLAWVTQHGVFWSAPSNQDWRAASQDLFARFYASGGRRIIGIGSCAEYDWSVGDGIFHENAPLAPHTAYGRAKAETGDALADLANRTGTSWAWGRLFFTFGPGEPPDRLIPSMLQAVRQRQPVGVGPGDTVRDFVDVRHMGKAIADLALSEVPGAVNLGSGIGHSFSDLAAKIHALDSGPPVIRTDSRSLGPGEPRTLIANVEKLRNEVGYLSPTSLAEDLAAYYAVPC